MLVEVWDNADGGCRALVPADPGNYAHRCRRITETDWRYLRRFHTGRPERVADTALTPFRQAAYRFDPEGAGALRTMAEAYS